jgi:hypothetical protein
MRFYPDRYYRVAADGALCIAVSGWDPPDLGRTPYNKSTSRRIFQAPDLRGLRYALVVGDARLDTKASVALERCQAPDPGQPFDDYRAAGLLKLTGGIPPGSPAAGVVRSTRGPVVLCGPAFHLCNWCSDNCWRPETRSRKPTEEQLHWWRYRFTAKLA